MGKLVGGVVRALLDTVFNLIRMCADIVDQHAQPTQRVRVGVRVLLTIPPPGPEQYPDLDPGGLPLPMIIPNHISGRHTIRRVLHSLQRPSPQILWPINVHNRDCGHPA